MDNFNQPIAPMENPPENKTNKKMLLILIIILAVIVLAAVVWLVFLKQDKVVVQEVNKNAENTFNQKNEEKRPGKLRLQTDKTIFKTGDELVVKILMDTNNSNIVLASAEVVYDPLYLQLKEINEDDSALTMGVVAKDKDGVIDIVRGIPGNGNPDDSDNGYTGNGGLLAELTFKVLKPGQTATIFSSLKSYLILDSIQGTKMETTYNNLDLNIQ